MDKDLYIIYLLFSFPQNIIQHDINFPLFYKIINVLKSEKINYFYELYQIRINQEINKISFKINNNELCYPLKYNLKIGNNFIYNNNMKRIINH